MEETRCLRASRLRVPCASALRRVINYLSLKFFFALVFWLLLLRLPDSAPALLAQPQNGTHHKKPRLYFFCFLLLALLCSSSCFRPAGLPAGGRPWPLPAWPPRRRGSVCALLSKIASPPLLNLLSCYSVVFLLDWFVFLWSCCGRSWPCWWCERSLFWLLCSRDPLLSGQRLCVSGSVIFL